MTLYCDDTLFRKIDLFAAVLPGDSSRFFGKVTGIHQVPFLGTAHLGLIGDDYFIVVIAAAARHDKTVREGAIGKSIRFANIARAKGECAAIGTAESHIFCKGSIEI